MTMHTLPWPVAPGPVPAPERPRGVFAAAYLLAGAAALWLTAMTATMFVIPQYERHYAESTQSSDGGLLAVGLLFLAAGVAVLAAALFVLLAFLDAHGRPAARVLTWVFGGLAFGAAVLILSSGMFVGISWHQWLMNGIAVVTLVLLSIALVLLALPSSSAYFRRSREHRHINAQRAHLARYGMLPTSMAGYAPQGTSPVSPVTADAVPGERTVFGLGRTGWIGIAAGIMLLAVMVVAAYPKR